MSDEPPTFAAMLGDGVGDFFGGPPRSEALAALGHLNAAIRSLASEHGAALADVHAHFLGHGYHHADPANPHHRADDPSDPPAGVELNVEHNARGGESRQGLRAVLCSGGASARTAIRSSSKSEVCAQTGEYVDATSSKSEVCAQTGEYVDATSSRSEVSAQSGEVG